MTAPTPTEKQFISAKLDTALVAELEHYAKARGISRSSAMRRAIETLLLVELDETPTA